MTGIILHHYPQSPVSEKVRVGLGIKNATWRSVEIPRLPPKPDLMPLTGGYRRTPVMQIGADIYCDSDCILRELDRRIPEPEFYPDKTSGWDSSGIFDLIFRLVLVFTGDAMPEGFVEDRGRLYLGPNWNMAEVSAKIPDITLSLRERFSALDTVLSGKYLFLGGNSPSAEDATAYHLVWFLRGRWSDGPTLLSEFPHLLAWEQRVAQIGHGNGSDMTPGGALDIAKNAEPETPSQIDEASPSSLQIGQEVSVTPDSDGGDPDVSGTVHYVDTDTIALLRHDDLVGTVCVYFPRNGYLIRND